MTLRSFLDKTPRIAESAYVDEAAIIIGDVNIGEDVSVWPMAVLRGDDQAIVIGARSNIQDGTVIHVASSSELVPGGLPTVIGADVTVGHKAMLHACTVGSRCLVGMSATILDGAVLEDHVVVGAGSLVPMGKVLEGGYLYIGAPVRRARKVNEKEAWFVDYAAKHYVQLKNQYRADLSRI